MTQDSNYTFKHIILENIQIFRVTKRYGDVYVDPMTKLKELRQTTNGNEYRDAFDAIIND